MDSNPPELSAIFLTDERAVELSAIVTLLVAWQHLANILSAPARRPKSITQLVDREVEEFISGAIRDLKTAADRAQLLGENEATLSAVRAELEVLSSDLLGIGKSESEGQLKRIYRDLGQKLKNDYMKKLLRLIRHLAPESEKQDAYLLLNFAKGHFRILPERLKLDWRDNELKEMFIHAYLFSNPSA